MIDLAALQRANATICAFVDWCDDVTSGQGPLAGVTVGVKSNLAVRGLPWTGGMGWRREMIADRDASVVARLHGAGAAILGTVNMHEAALGATTDNPFYGRTHNPWRMGFTAGGSSGGSAAAVAAGLCDVALGTDTLGSIRIPAAYCGLYGLKPTYGLLPADGLIFLDPAFDCIGPIAADLDLLEKTFMALSDTGTAASQTPFNRLLVLDDLGGVSCDSAVVDGYQKALSAIDLPRTVLQLPARPGAIRLAALVQAVDRLETALGAHRPDVSDELDHILKALAGKPADNGLLRDLRDQLPDTLGANGILLMPTTPQTAFAHDSRPPANQADFTTLASIAGLPALAVPTGLSPDGLPTSVQLVGPKGSDHRLIALARAVEPILGGSPRPSPIAAEES